MNHEDLLRETLAAKAADASVDLTLDDIRRYASGRRHRARRRAALVLAAAAVLAAVAVPSALLLRDDGPGPAAPTTPPSTSPSPTSPPTSPSSTPAAKGHVLESIPQGRPPGITYLQDGVVHLSQGGTTPLPAGTVEVTAFTGYHGGWLVAVGGGTTRMVWYDGTGTQKSVGSGIGRFAVSEDGTRTAYPQSGAIHIGITSGMSSGEQTLPGKASEISPVGFLRGGALVYQAGVGKVAITGGGTLPQLAIARAVSATDDLVAGEDGNRQTVVVSSAGRVQWRSTDWYVWGFSADGRYAAATGEPPDGSYSKVAILDAHTGQVVAQHDLPGAGVGIGPQPVMDTDGSLLIAATDGNTLRETVLRLDRDGSMTRATQVFPLDSSSDATYVMFATRP